MGAGRGRRTGLVLIVVIILLLLGGVIVIYLLSQTPATPGPGGGSQQATVAPTPTTVKLIVAARDIARGTRMAASDVTTIDWPLTVPLPQGGMTVGEGPDQPGLEQVEGRVTRVDILAQQPVQSFMLTAADQAFSLQASGSDAALLIPSGQVAIALPLNRLSSVAYAIRTGDHVDIMISYRFVDVDEKFQTFTPNAVEATLLPTGITLTGDPPTIEGREVKGPFGGSWVITPAEVTPRPRQTTQLMIKNAIVMRVGDWPLTEAAVVVATQAPAAQAAPTATPAGGAGAPPTPAPVPVPSIVTLIMSRQDALVLKFSLEMGASIDFALRSALDNGDTNVTTENVTLQYLMDFYNLAEPPRLPIAIDPRTDTFLNTPNGQFPVLTGGNQFTFPEPTAQP